MRAPVALRALLTAILVGGPLACASAGKRLDQGLEAEAAGDYYGAAFRYLDAVDKDPSLVEARQRALVAGDSALARGMADAASLLATGDAVAAGEEYLALDRLLRRGTEVGVELATPDRWVETRRATFDASIEALMRSGDVAARQARWGEARSAFQRIRGAFAPSLDQRRRSEGAEARTLLSWAESEEDEERFRRAWDLAAEALAVSPSPAAEWVDRASGIQDRALVRGERVVAVFPVTTTAPVRERMQADLDQQLADLLELEYWRAPPLFVVVADPVAVRHAIRRLTRGGGAFHPAPVLAEVEADFGVLIELALLDREERDVDAQLREARTRDGRTTNYTLERGTVTYVVEATVLVTDRRGREIADFRVRETEGGRFERGSYRGDPDELDLGRDERRLFDPLVQRSRMAEVEAGLVEELAGRVADQVYSRILSRIP
jgi:tetratricopeptide (TPR) repeat protein